LLTGSHGIGRPAAIDELGGNGPKRNVRGKRRYRRTGVSKTFVRLAVNWMIRSLIYCAALVLGAQREENRDGL